MALRTSRGDQNPDENEIPPTSSGPKLSDPVTGTHATVPTADSHQVDGSHNARATLKTVWSPYRFDLLSAIQAGIVATLFFLVVWYLIYFAVKDPSLDIAMMIGAFLTPTVDWTSRLLGIGGLLGMGITLAIVYALGLLTFKMQTGMGKGLLFGMMIFIPMMAFVFPFSIGFLARFGVSHAYLHNPDVMFNQTGNTGIQWAVAFWALMAHMVFGSFLGLVYRHKLYEGIGTRYELEYAGG